MSKPKKSSRLGPLSQSKETKDAKNRASAAKVKAGGKAYRRLLAQVKS